MGSGNDRSRESADDTPGSDDDRTEVGSDRTETEQAGADHARGTNRTQDTGPTHRDRIERNRSSKPKHAESSASQRSPPRTSETISDADQNRDRTPRRSTSDQGPVRQFLTADQGPAVWIRDVVSSVLIVLAIGALLFAVTGVWPPMVAVESGSMDPNMEKGDLIVVTEPGRLAPGAATNDIGVVTAEVAEQAGYQSFDAPGSVIVYTFPGRVGSPIIHRAMFHVDAGENWVDRADDRYLSGETCADVQHCPAPHSGFITKGDNNGRYDQASGIAPPVKPEWVTGVARVRLPYLGWIRLVATGQATMDEFIEAVTSGTLGHPGAIAIAGSAAIGSAAIRRTGA